MIRHDGRKHKKRLIHQNEPFLLRLTRFERATPTSAAQSQIYNLAKSVLFNIAS